MSDEPSRALIPDWVPAAVVPVLDSSELAADARATRELLARLDDALTAHVAAYRLDGRGRGSGLCQLFRAATLGATDFELLACAEARMPDLLLVAYASPLERIEWHGGPASGSGESDREISGDDSGGV